MEDPSDRRRLEEVELLCLLFGRIVAVVPVAADLIADPNDVLLVFFASRSTWSTTLISLRLSFSSCNKALAFFPNSFTFPSIGFAGRFEFELLVLFVLFWPCRWLPLFRGGILEHWMVGMCRVCGAPKVDPFE